MKLRPHVLAQDLHVDCRREGDGWPMAQKDVLQDPSEDYEGQMVACGPAGSVIIYNGRLARTCGKPSRSAAAFNARRLYPP